MMGGRGAALTSGPTGLSRGLEHRPGIDGLRALAVAAVVAFHLDRLPGGNLGVDAFFVISGWLITSQLLASVTPDSSRPIDLPGFWSARVRRLLPASALTLLAIAVVWTALDIEVASLRRDIVWALGWGANWGTITDGGDYWARFGEASPVAHFWSLAVEEQFYLAWPLVLWVVLRRGGRTRRVGWTAAVLAIVSVTTMVLLFDPTDPTATYLHTGARAHSLLLGAGAAAATIAARSRPWLRTSLRWLLPPAVATALAIIVLSDEGSTWLYQWGFPTYAAAVAIVVMRVADGAGGWLAHPALRWIGDRSYAIYLWHWPVILLLSPSRLSITEPARDVLAVAASLVLAAASHRWLEQPIRRSPRVTWTWAPGIALGTLAGCLLVLGFSTPAPRTSLQAASTVTLPPPSATSTRPATTSTAGSGSTSLAELEAAVLAAYVTATPTTASPTTAAAPVPPSPLRTLVVGDSTAVQLAGALVPMAQGQPEQLIVGSAAFPGCGLTAANDGRLHASTGPDGSTQLTDLSGCVHQWSTLKDRIVTEAVDVVVVHIGAWDGTDIHLADGRVVSIVDFAGRQLIEDAYRRFVADVEAAGARVVWVLPPDLDVRWEQLDTAVDDPARWVAMRAVIERLDVDEIDLHGWLGRQALGGPDARPDGVHLTPALNERFAREVAIPELLRLRAGLQAG